MRQERARREWSQADLSKRLQAKGLEHIIPSTVAKIESGDRAVRIDEANALADLFAVSLDELLGRNLPERDLTSTLENLYDTTRQASSQLTATENSLRALTDELTGFDFNQRDHLIGLSKGACDALARANEKLAYLHLSPHFMAATQEKYMAELMAQLSWIPGAAPLLSMMKGQLGDDEAQS